MPLLRRRYQVPVPESPLFAGCSHRERQEVGRLGTAVMAEAGMVLTPEGHSGREFFVIEDGHASCRVRGVIKARFERGDFFGEIALLDGGPRTATVIAETPMQLVVFDAGEFRSMLNASPLVRHRLLVEMSRRLRAANVAA